MSSNNSPGTLEVGTNESHEVVVNLPQDMTGHIVFSPMQARILADTLIRKSIEAERDHRAKLEAERIANIPPADRSKVCTTSGRQADIVRAEQTEEIGQHKDYIVLCEDERKKGFVRPYRDSYKHVGALVTTVREAPMSVSRQRQGGCGTVTTMGRALSETYARDPKFYGATFCVGCNEHLPVAEFTWTADGQVVGS